MMAPAPEKRIVARVAPSAADGIVHFPDAGADAGRRTRADFFKIKDGADGFRVFVARRERGLFCADGNFLAPFFGAIVIVSRDAQLERVEIALVHAVVEPQNVGPVFVNQLDIAREPVGQEPFARRVAAVGDIVKIRPFRIVKVGLLGLHFGGHVGGRIDELEIFDAVVGHAEFQSLLAHGLGKIADKVAVRPHVSPR